MTGTAPMSFACHDQEFKKRLKDEYLSLGGSPNTVRNRVYHCHLLSTACNAALVALRQHVCGVHLQPMGSNYFLWIIVIVSILAVLSWALGYI